MVSGVVEKIEKYHPGADLDLILRAYDFALKAHDGQTRESGEEYIQHPLEVAAILTEMEMDSATIAAGLLHDVVEDTDITLDTIREQFGEEVADLVDGLTKLTLMSFQAPEEKPSEDGAGKKSRELQLKRQAENLRKILLAMARDIRVMVIKLADRLHNMRTLGCCSPEKQRKIARETMQIYAPLAHRLGIWTIKWQLEDLAFKYLEPEQFNEVAERVARTRKEREADIDHVIHTLEEGLKDAGIEAMIQGRPKHLWSIYQKMKNQEISFEEIYDLTALRVIVHTVAECYHALGIVHDLWMPIPSMFSDHIAKPKSNMYQSLHTKVVGPGGDPLEIQIRTFEMHRTADFGVAAHWRYKEGGKPADIFESKLEWLRRQMFDWSSENQDSGEFLRSVTQDLFTDQVFVFTPKGDVVDLPAGSTPVDYAYRVHSKIGDTCAGARVNGRIVPLSTALRNGDVIEIITRSGAHPSFDWLSFVKSSHARAKIRAYFRRLRHAENVGRGRELLEKEATRLGLDRAAIKENELERVLSHFKMNTLPDLLAAVGSGSLGASTVLTRLREQSPAPDPSLPAGVIPAKEAKLNIKPGGVDQVLIKRSRCCQPLPGDSVVGYVSRGRGMILHQEGCKNLAGYAEKEAERLVPVEWEPSDGELYPSSIKIEALNRVGLLNDISAVFSEARLNIRSANIVSGNGGGGKNKPDFTPGRHQIALFDFTVDVQDTAQLNSLMATLRSRVADVLDVYRLTNSARPDVEAPVGAPA
ncbi:MAG: bifunctional (p)ppGpp synthetase/guanosine-3',5'-bis(diphosphate) 3'-pyrophosphohydrolase [Armatimonadetes bacterium]|nr:bifunctional (p)ppGpp synthetase/guanosine-3',5'-bis(diphosphate) 3'-pyrophosphohydrolase [Armatimonadota bacterium]